MQTWGRGSKNANILWTALMEAPKELRAPMSYRNTLLGSPEKAAGVAAAAAAVADDKGMSLVRAKNIISSCKTTTTTTTMTILAVGTPSSLAIPQLHYGVVLLSNFMSLLAKRDLSFRVFVTDFFVGIK